VKPKSWTRLVSQYQLGLGAYVARGNEEALQRAYELGRKALNLGLGVVDVARLHQEAVVGLVTQGHAPAATARWAKAVETFLMETLSAFEVAHRGFRDACERLVRLNDTLKDRHEELAVSIKKLAHEVARRKKTQELLQESELKFRSVIESAQDGIVTVDSRGRVVAVNHGAEEMFGYGRKELVGKAVSRLIPRPLRAAALFTLKCLAEGGERQLLKRPIQSVGLHRDGTEFSLEFTLASWRTRAGVFFTGVVRDIRERKQAELALRESREHYIRLFEEARAMEENLRQLSNKVLTVQEEERKHISRELHDEIGQALTAVNVSVAMLRSHAAGDEAFRKKVDTAQRLLEHSMDMVHQFARELRPSMRRCRTT
jgi:PAS domain S-box-containing protein